MPRKLPSLKLADYNDRELLFVIDGEADAEGFASTTEIASKLGFIVKDEDPRYGVRCAGTRLGYMRRQGWLERDDTRTAWRVTEMGKSLMSGRLTKGLEQALLRVKPADRVLVMRALTEGYNTSLQGEATMLRREWQYGTGRR